MHVASTSSHIMRASGALLLVWMTGCGLLPKSLAIPPDLHTDGDTWEVHGGMNAFQSKIKFGPYRAFNAESSGTSSTVTTPRIWTGQTKRESQKETAAFDFKGLNGGTFVGECRRDKLIVRQRPSLMSRKQDDENVDQAGFGIIDEQSSFHCTITRKDDAPIRLVMNAGSSGTAEGANVKLSITGLDSEGSAEPIESGGASGYLINDDEVQAQVEVFPRRVVSLSHKPPLSKRDAVAAVCAALLVMSEMLE